MTGFPRWIRAWRWIGYTGEKLIINLRQAARPPGADRVRPVRHGKSTPTVYAGLDLAENGMFTGMRGRQIAGRFAASSEARAP